MDETIFDDGYAILDETDRDEPEVESTALITITSLPQIKENLRALRESWERKAADATALVCTEDTVQAIKQTRADMRKEYEEADRQRKDAKARYLAPWNAVEDTFKECVSDAFKRADAALKATVDEYEGEIKARCREELERYFAEMCEVHGVDFLTFDQAMAIGKLKIGMTEANAKTPRKLQDGLGEVVARIAVGMDQIMGMDDAPEIMTEYKLCFDVGRAVSTVQERKRKIEAEQEAKLARIRRQEAQEAAIQKAVAIATAPVEQKSKEGAFSRETAQEPIFEEFTFTVYNVTRSQLIRVRDYLKQEGIKYE